MSLGLRPRTPGICYYKDYQIVQSHGRFFALPCTMDAENLLKDCQVHLHPSVLRASSSEELRVQIDAQIHHTQVPHSLGNYRGYELLEHRGAVFGVLHSHAQIDLDDPDARKRTGVITGGSEAEVLARIDRLADTSPVEFAGWLPIYKVSGNCGRHPQFTHTVDPPPGYRFTCSAPPPRRPTAFLDGLRRSAVRVLNALYQGLLPLGALFRSDSGTNYWTRFRIAFAALGFLVRLLRNGARLLPALRFLQSRHFQSQLLASRAPGLTFLTSMPYTYGQNPWIIEIEDPTTLFYPFIHNGQTCDLRIEESPYLSIVTRLLEEHACRGIITHMRSTAEMLRILFKSEAIHRKISYIPLGVRLPQQWQRHELTPFSAPIRLLFINSWCQAPGNFCLRGGLDILEAFAILRIRYPQLQLTMRTNLPKLDSHYYQIIESNWVRIIDRFMTDEEMANLHLESHIFLLPAARVHIVSLLQAMSYGLAVVASDGWGFEEYVRPEHNALVVKGRHETVSWADMQSGFLREDYQPMYSSNPKVVQGIVDAVSRLIEDPVFRAKIGHTARQDVQDFYNLDRWNQGLARAFDKALALDSRERL